MGKSRGEKTGELKVALQGKKIPRGKSLELTREEHRDLEKKKDLISEKVET